MTAHDQNEERTTEEIANEIGLWMLEQWSIISRNLLREASGLPFEAKDGSTSLFRKIKEAIDSERAKQKALEEEVENLTALIHKHLESQHESAKQVSELRSTIARYKGALEEIDLAIYHKHGAYFDLNELNRFFKLLRGIAKDALSGGSEK